MLRWPRVNSSHEILSSTLNLLYMYCGNLSQVKMQQSPERVITLAAESVDANKRKRSNTENFVWTDSEVELLLSIVQEYKTQKTNDGVYSDSCKNKYTELNDMFAEKLLFMEGTPNDEYPRVC